MNTHNHQIIFRQRPTGISDLQTFASQTVPVTPPADGDVLLETLYVSVDPAMRVWLSDNPGYVAPVAVGNVMRAGGIGRVVESRDPELRPGGWPFFRDSKNLLSGCAIFASSRCTRLPKVLLSQKMKKPAVVGKAQRHDGNSSTSILISITSCASAAVVSVATSMSRSTCSATVPRLATRK
jgi:NADPH-dependent curcumin reductase CurA